MYDDPEDPSGRRVMWALIALLSLYLLLCFIGGSDALPWYPSN